MKIILLSISTTLVLATGFSATIAAQQPAQSGNSGSDSTSNNTSGSQATTNQQNSNTTQTQTQTANQGESTQLKISESVQTALSNNKTTYSTSNSIYKKNLDDTLAATGKLITLSAQVAEQNQGLATQIQQIAKEQVLSTQQSVQSLDRANDKNSVMKFLFGTDYSQINTAKEQMEQNRNRIQILNQIKTQINNSGLQTELQTQITTLEAQNTALQQNIDSVVGEFSLLGWLFNWLN